MCQHNNADTAHLTLFFLVTTWKMKKQQKFAQNKKVHEKIRHKSAFRKVTTKE